MPSARVKRAIRAFENAVEDKTLGNTDYALLNEAELLVVEHNYVKARAKLERLMENL